MASPSASAPASLSSHPVEAALIWGAALVPLVLLAHSLLPRRRIQSGKTSWRHARLVKAAVPLMGRSPSLPPPSAPPKPVDLTGYWLNTEIRGDFRAYMVSMGAPFLVQQAAKDQDYGVGKMRNVISNQTRWHLSLETNFPFVHSIDLELDGREREYGKDPLGRTLRYCARWEGSELVAYRGGVLLWKRGLEGPDTMLWHLFDSSGERVTRVFRKEAPILVRRDQQR